MMKPPRERNIDYFSITLVTLTASLVVWLLPMIRGKTADLTYAYIQAEEIPSELLSVDELNKLHHTTPIKSKPKPPCPVISPSLEGLNLDVPELPWNDEIVHNYAKDNNILPGGVWQPSHCRPRYAVSKFS